MSSDEIATAGVTSGEVAPAGFDLVDDHSPHPETGMALCLSGGGYRATLFHLGAIWRLNELGLLGQLKRISSVSGGSITSAVLGMEWTQLGWTEHDGLRFAAADAFQDRVVGPLRKMTATSIDVSSVLWGSLNPWTWVSDEVAKKYDEVLFHHQTLQSLPDDTSGPRFVINATNVKTGSLWRFSRPYIADYRVGIIENPNIPLSLAVAASSAFPPVLSPMRLALDPAWFKPGVPAHDVARELRTEAILTDGGVYDNLGLETAWKRYKTILVSDAGRKMDDDLHPATDWAGHSRRLIDLLQHQISSLRRRIAVGTFDEPGSDHNGTYWGIQTDIDRYQLANHIPCPHDKTLLIAGIPTRLTALKSTEQDRIINWGYAVADAAVRRHIDAFKAATAPSGFPYPLTGLG
ncbi:MAG: patatin-like phospholipase family protein [Pirellulales bacterium]